MATVAGKRIGSMGYGLMSLTRPWDPTGNDQAFEVMKLSLDSGANFWNGGEFYGSPAHNSLHVLRDYFTKYPEDADKVVLCIKGAMDMKEKKPIGDEEGIRRSVDECLRILGNRKKIEMFECARVDPKVPIEASMRTLAKYVQAGKIGAIGLSEVSVESIRRACKITKIGGVEVEFSLFATHILENGVAAACAELDIPIFAYSPLGRGYLTDDMASLEALPEKDFRQIHPRFQGDNFQNNIKIARQVQKIAENKGCTLSQVACAWIRAKGEEPGMPRIIPIPGTKSPSRVVENLKIISLSNEEKAALDEIVENSTVQGNRYPEAFNHLSNGDSPLEQ